MEGAKLIERIRLRNILSFGEEGQELALEPLNVLIGPNGSGKSNLIAVLSLLRGAPNDIGAALRAGGSVGEWIWKGDQYAFITNTEIGIDVRTFPFSREVLSYQLEFTDYARQHFTILNESLEGLTSETENPQPVSYYRHENNRPHISAFLPTSEGTGRKRVQLVQGFSDNGWVDGISRRESILSQIKDVVQYPELTRFGRALEEIQLYRELSLGSTALARLPQRADLPDSFLLEDASNLGLVLNLLEMRGRKRRVIELMQRFYEPTEDFTIRVQGGTVQFYLHERGLSQPISAMRLSDGTLHFLYLLAILLHPDPPPLICIEEPEIGLHPDVIPTVAELLVEASQRTQLIVTTHSDALVSALSATPEAIVICERDERGTQLRRLEPERLKEWLERYTLGELWHMGEIGGTRW